MNTRPITEIPLHETLEHSKVAVEQIARAAIFLVVVGISSKRKPQQAQPKPACLKPNRNASRRDRI
jgi:hypothetical protein